MVFSHAGRPFVPACIDSCASLLLKLHSCNFTIMNHRMKIAATFAAALLVAGLHAESQSTFNVPAEVDLSVLVLDDVGMPVEGAVIELVEYGIQAVADQDGRARLSFDSLSRLAFLRVTGPPVPQGAPLTWNYVPIARLEEVRPFVFSGMERGGIPSENPSTQSIEHRAQAYAVVHLKPLGDWMTPPIDSQGGRYSNGAFLVDVPADACNEPLRLVLTLVPSQCTTLPDDFSQPGWSFENLGQIDVAVLGSDGKIRPSFPFQAPVKIEVYDSNLHEDRDGNGDFETFCGLDTHQLAHLLDPLRMAYLDQTSLPIEAGMALYNPINGRLRYTVTRAGSWLVRGPVNPPQGVGSHAEEGGDACDGPTTIEVTEEAREMARAQILCGGPAGTAYYQWTMGSEVSWHIEAHVDVRSLGAKLGLSVGADGRLYRSHSGGGTAGDGQYHACLSGDSVVDVVFRVARVICVETQKEIGRVETEVSSETRLVNVEFPDSDCPGCGGKGG